MMATQRNTPAETDFSANFKKNRSPGYFYNPLISNAIRICVNVTTIIFFLILCLKAKKYLLSKHQGILMSVLCSANIKQYAQLADTEYL